MIKEQTYVPLYYDFMFKGVFANEKDLRPITALLSSFLEIPYEELVGRVSIKNTEMVKKNVWVVGKVLDILVKLDSGEVINVEMNTSPEVIDRNVSYLCEVYSREQSSSRNGYKIPKCIQINFNMHSKQESTIETYMICNEKGKPLVNNFIIYQVSVEKCMEKCYNQEELTEQERWGFLMKIERIDLLKEELKTMKMPEEVRTTILKRIDELNANEDLDYMRDVEWDAKQRLEAAKDYGVEQGFEKGISQEKFSIARKLKTTGLSIEQISEATGLSKEEILEL